MIITGFIALELFLTFLVILPFWIGAKRKISRSQMNIISWLTMFCWIPLCWFIALIISCTSEPNKEQNGYRLIDF